MIKIASYKEWAIMSEVVDQTGRATLMQYDKAVADSEDVFDLLSKCPDVAATSMRKQIVADMIQSNGGPDAYQASATNNRILFGNDFYDFMDDATIQEFADQGVFLSYKY
jgi:hypothetical protein